MVVSRNTEIYILLLLPPGDPVRGAGVLAGGGAAGLAGAATTLDQAQLEREQDRRGEQRKKTRQIKVFLEIYRYLIYFEIICFQSFSVFYFLIIKTCLLQNLTQSHTNQSQTMRKLNPMNRPRTPPQSATRDPNVKASSSFRTRTDVLANTIDNNVMLPLITSRSSRI